MCGRYVLYHSKKQIADRFKLTHPTLEFEPRYNISPTQQVLAIIDTGEQRELTQFKWGLIPFWAKDPKIASQLINARAETISEKPSFRNALVKRRCLIPANGWYEWKKGAGGSQPYLIGRTDNELLSFAGLWEEWKSPEGEKIQTCTIITVEANDLLQKVHHRMPALIGPEHEEEWLDAGSHYAPGIVQLLRTYEGDDLQIVPVSKSVNSPTHDSASLIEPIDFSLK